MSLESLDTTENISFEQDAAKVLLRLRNALSAIIKSADPRVDRACDVTDIFEVHSKLGWQVSKVAYEPHLLAVARYVPTPGGMKTFLKAARRRVAVELVDDAGAAMDDFQRLIEVHAGDREAFDVMLASCAGAEGAHLSQRKTWFTAASFVMGVQAKVRIVTSFISPSSTRAGWFDGVHFSGYLKLRRLRSNTAWEIARTKREFDNSADCSQPRRQSLDAPDELSGGVPSAPLLRRFCSQPLPQIQRETLADGWVRDVLVAGPVGETAAVDCFVGEVWHEWGPCYRTKNNWLWFTGTMMRTPCQVLILDQFIHEDVFGLIQPQMHLYRDVIDEPRPPLVQREGDRIPVFERVQHLGKGISGISTLDVPRYEEMIAYALERVGQDASCFNAYRVRMEFPPVPTSVTMENPLPEPP